MSDLVPPKIKPGEIAFPFSPKYATYVWADEDRTRVLHFLRNNEPVFVLSVYALRGTRGFSVPAAKVLSSKGVGFCVASLLKKDTL